MKRKTIIEMLSFFFPVERIDTYTFCSDIDLYSTDYKECVSIVFNESGILTESY